jgi:hypothetical protein
MEGRKLNRPCASVHYYPGEHWKKFGGGYWVGCRYLLLMMFKYASILLYLFMVFYSFVFSYMFSSFSSCGYAGAGLFFVWRAHGISGETSLGWSVPTGHGFPMGYTWWSQWLATIDLLRGLLVWATQTQGDFFWPGGLALGQGGYE